MKNMSKQQRVYRNVLAHILDQHVYKPKMFSDDVLNHCSEQSLVVKFWGPVFEHFFGYDDNIFLQWGDTLSTCHKDMGMTRRLDLRIIATTNSSTMEVSTGEFASFEVIISLYNYTRTNVDPK
ncbi:unnamed protein product [Absidia cylindrospora]